MYQMIRYQAPVGELILAANQTGLCALVLSGQKYQQRHIPDHAQAGKATDSPILQDACRWLDAYFAGKRPHVEQLPLAPLGTAFQKCVWQQLLTIPYGKTTTYGKLATQLGSGAQAVGNAVGRNPISILIPCHRVLGADGSLVGYAGGLAAKRQLLMLEGILL